jgi:hypothetical protein
MAKAMGGSVKPTWNAGEGQNAAKEAMERKRGGKVEHMEGEGEMAKERHDRPKRAKGGKMEKHRAKGGRVKGEGVGADRMPLSTAAKIKEVTPGEQAEDANED